MPYFIYQVFSDKKLELVDEFPAFPVAKKIVKQLRAEQTDPEAFRYQIIFAKNPSEAEMLLKEKREALLTGED